MSLSTKERRNAFEANNPPCRNGCGSRVYWREGAYCKYCAALPERWCFECNRASHTAGSECLDCHAPYGRLTFGFDRLSDTPPWGRKSENQRVSGWTDKTPHPDAVWHEAEPTGWLNGVQMVTPFPVFKAKVPGIAWKADPRPPDGMGGPSTAWMRKSVAEVNWYSCGACGKSFGPGDGHKTRRMIEAAAEGRYSYTGPLAHRDCPLTEAEDAAMNAWRHRAA